MMRSVTKVSGGGSSIIVPLPAPTSNKKRKPEEEQQRREEGIIYRLLLVTLYIEAKRLKFEAERRAQIQLAVQQTMLKK
jgi:hypothetical protein